MCKHIPSQGILYFEAKYCQKITGLMEGRRKNLNLESKHTFLF